MQDARQLAMSMKAPTLEALAAGDNGKRRERKVGVFIVPSVVCYCPRGAAKKFFGCGKVNSNRNNSGNETEPECRSKCLDTDPRLQFESTMRRRI
jgi:hypothetical protein